MSAAIDRACAFGILADGGPMTCEEVRRALPNTTAWDYGRVHYALRIRVRSGWLRAAGQGRGQHELWHVPLSELPVPPEPGT